MKFKQISGKHVENGVKYVAGDIIESDSDLAARFGSKFQRIYEEPAPAKPVVAKPASTPAPVPPAGQPPSRRTNLPKKAAEAQGKKLKAKHISGGRYDVIEVATGKKVNTAPLTKEVAEAMEQ